MSNVANIRTGLDVDCGGMPDPSVREEITQLVEDIHNAVDVGRVEGGDPPVRHIFSKGVYAREITMAKNTLVVGKIHKTSHINIISKGDVTVKTQFGMNRYKAPHTFISPVGVQRVVFCHEETIWTTIHPTEETDLDKIESDIIAKSYDEIRGLYGPEKHPELEEVKP